MADISTELANIMSAIYGEEVRGSIHDAIEKMNTQLNSAASSTLNGLGFKGDLGTSDGTTYNLNSLTTTGRRGIWRLQANRNYTNAPDDYDQSKTGYLIMYSFGTVDSTASNIKQEIHYFSDSGANANVCWSRVYISGSWTEWKKNVDSLLMTEGAAADAYIVGTRLNNITNKWGLMSVMEPVISDIDQIIAQGIYFVMRSSAPNWPFDNPGLLLVLNAHNANRETSGPSKDALVQMAFVDGAMDYRIYGTNAWGEWTHSDTDTSLSIEGSPADAKAVGDKALISKQAYLPVGDNANLNNFYTQGIYSIMSPQGTQNWPFGNAWGVFVVLNANNATGSFSAYSVVQLAFCEGKYAFRTSKAGTSAPVYSEWIVYEIDDTLSISGAAADAKAVGDAISEAVENVVSSKGIAMSTDPEHPVKDLNDYKNPGIYYVGATRVTNWAFDDNYRGVLVIFNPMTSAVAMTDSIVQMAFSNGEFAYRMFNGYGTGQTELWSDWVKNDNGRLLEIIESIADVNSVQNEIEATTNQNYYLEKTAGTTCRVKSSTGTELVLYSVAVTAKKNYRVIASNVASIDNAILAFATRALADNVACTMLIDNTGDPAIDYFYSPTQDGYLFLSKGTNASMTYHIYEIDEETTLKDESVYPIIDKYLEEYVPTDFELIDDGEGNVTINVYTRFLSETNEP